MIFRCWMKATLTVSVIRSMLIAGVGHDSRLPPFLPVCMPRRGTIIGRVGSRRAVPLKLCPKGYTGVATRLAIC